MRTRLFIVVCALSLLAGCGGPWRKAPDRQERLSDFTKNYRNVFDTAYDVVNRYAVVKWADRARGEIVGERLMTNELFHKTRRTIHARVVRGRRINDVEIRVLIEIENSEPDTIFADEPPRFHWQVVGSDTGLETKLNNEVRLALSDNSYLKKHNPRHDPYPRVEETPEERAESSDDAPTSEKKEEKAKEEGGTRTKTRSLPSDRVVRGLPERDASNRLESLAVQYFKEGNYGLAKETFQTALLLDPARPEAHLLLAQCHLAEEEFEAGASTLRDGLTHARPAELLCDIRARYGNTADFDRHLHALLTRVEGTPNDEAARLLLGALACCTGDYPTARRIFKELVRNHPGEKTYRTFYNLAETRYHKSRGLKAY